MNRLSFENVDVGTTPLSSLRSCSEYQTRHERNVAMRRNSNRNYWTALFRWDFLFPRRRKQRVRFADREENEQEFLVERFRFNSSNLMEGEQHSRTPERLMMNSRSSVDSLMRKRLFSDAEIGKYGSGKTFVQEASWLVDVMFGLRTTTPANQVMEIELQNLRPPQRLAVYDCYHSDGELESAELESRESGLGIRRVTSLRSLERVQDDSSRPTVSFSTSTCTHPVLGAPTPEDESVLRAHWRSVLRSLRNYYQPDDNFYELIRIQPFSSGAYLRCMLLAGLSGLVFQIYNFATWPREVELGQLTLLQHFLQSAMMATLCLQIAVNVLCLPSRMKIHLQCWESSRAVDVESAIRVIRAMLQSDSWLLNKSIGAVVDILAVVSVALTEIYLWSAAVTDPLRGLAISLCATNMLTLVCRVVIATMYSLSMHDPQVLSEARRRGLSKWDLDVLPTFVFSCREEVNNPDCSICLGCFDMGEMLISLPCDRKHSFHASCIRQWLQRQNSCPLCQKLV